MVTAGIELLVGIVALVTAGLLLLQGLNRRVSDDSSRGER
jgi:hypothetical protein